MTNEQTTDSAASVLTDGLERLGSIIEAALSSYRLNYTVDKNGDAYPLVEALSSPGGTIDSGMREIVFLADHIYSYFRSNGGGGPTFFSAMTGARANDEKETKMPTLAELEAGQSYNELLADSLRLRSELTFAWRNAQIIEDARQQEMHKRDAAEAKAKDLQLQVDALAKCGAPNETSDRY